MGRGSMSVNPTLTISISRTSLSLAALALSAANDATALGVVSYTEPAVEQDIEWAPDSKYVHGSVALSSKYGHSMLNFDAGTNLAATETDSRALFAELKAALNQFTYTVTVTVDGATAEVWTCQPGSLGAVSRSYEDLRSHSVVRPVSIPCHPVPS